jgi:medium-chain acyl-[acyl-carrier-protein] hydrolase
MTSAISVSPIALFGWNTAGLPRPISNMTQSASLDRWLPYRRAVDTPRFRVFAIPFAGAGASTFRTWPDDLPAGVECCAIQLPGRETRFAEPAFARMSSLIDALSVALRPLLDIPFILFGYSMGALVAFELARAWRRQGVMAPQALVLAAHAAPHRPSRFPRLHALADADFRAELRRLNGTPSAVLDNDELMRALMPTLRSDFELCETYHCADEPPLAVPIIACGGINDPRAAYDDLAAWQIHTRGQFDVRVFPGDHFFIQSQRSEFLAFLSQMISSRFLHAANSPQSRFPIDTGEVHVWTIRFDENVEKVCRLSRSLASDERDRAERFHFQRDRERFIVGRSALRSLLGTYLNRQPSDIPLWYNSQGKPFLHRLPSDPDLQFNVAHSGELALVALALARPLGIDVERLRSNIDWQDLCARYFSKSESAELQSLPEAERPRAFFAAWTRKEAYLKAHGVGLSLPLDQFSVSLNPREPARLRSTEHDPDQRDRWELHAFEPHDGYVAALAIAGRGLRIEHRNWTPPE